MSGIDELASADCDEAADVLCDAFFDYPVMRHVLRDSGADYARHLRTMVRFFVAARLARREHVLGIRGGDRLEAVALVSIPDGREAAPDLAEHREAVWRELGSEARARYEAFGEACAPFTVDVPHLHLNMIGVSNSAQGKGLGRRLLDHVHAMAEQHAGYRDITLTTEDTANLPLYEHFGYERIGHARVSDALETWGFFRPASSPSPGH